VLARRSGTLRCLRLVVVGCVLGCTSSPPPTASTPAPALPATAEAPPALDPARLDAVARRLDSLATEFQAFWQEHGPDPVNGGFFGTLDRAGQKKAPTSKGVIQQARHLYSTSLWYERRGQRPEVKALADNLYAFVRRSFRDADGEYFFTVDEAGTPVDKKKVLYAQAFAIYALSTYGRVFGVEEAKLEALTCFRSIDRRAHDAKYGGYDQTNDPAWLSKGAAKETNTHLHLMEAFAALHGATRDPVAGARAAEIVRLFEERIVQRDGYAAKEFLPDFTPFGTPAVSYGHDLETAWLLLDTSRALGRPNDSRVQGVALRLGENSAAAGFDPVRGGFFEEGPPGKPAVLREKIWWIQAEALPALFRLYELTGDSAHLGRLERTLDFIEQHQRDREHGGWFWGIREDGSLGARGDDKGGEWKASYHELRALVLTADWIRARVTAL